MPRNLKLAVGLYGLVFHAIVAAIAVAVALRNQARIGTGVFAVVVPALLAAGFLVYAVVVAPYVAKRSRASVLWDSAVGMLAEVAVAVVTSVLYAVLMSAQALASGGAGELLSSFAANATFAFLYTLGNFFVQVLVIGNAAGLVGWWILKKVRPAT
jgi:hypothetical protein